MTETKEPLADMLSRQAADAVEEGRFLSSNSHRSPFPLIDEALALATRALQLDEDHADAHFQAGRALSFYDRNEEALRHFNRALELAPGPQPRLWQERAVVLRNLKRWEEALADVEQLLALETTAGYVRLRGELLLELGQKDAAEQELRRAVSLGDSWAEHLLKSRLGISLPRRR